VSTIDINDPCPCGSGKQFKRCCFWKTSDKELTKVVPQKTLDHFAKVIQHERDQAALREIGICINYVRPFIFKEKKLYVIGNKFFRDRPPKETFHQFIVFYLKMLLGEEWYNDNLNAPEPHFIVTCFIKTIEWQRRVSIREKAVDGWKAIPDGFTRYLLSVAFDVATLQHTTQIPKSLIKRLKNKNEYQGVRYELAIAGIFARLDCEISFLEDKSKPHCEFIAKYRPTGIEIAVEVKSRHRPGVIHTPGSASAEDLLKGGIASLLRDALRQNPGDKPFMIFVI
jgi:SEC-C motif